MADTSKLWVTCQPCAHTWAAAHLPMEMSKVAKLMNGLRCPKCGDGGKTLFMATAAEIAALGQGLSDRFAPDAVPLPQEIATP